MFCIKEAPPLTPSDFNSLSDNEDRGSERHVTLFSIPPQQEVRLRACTLSLQGDPGCPEQFVDDGKTLFRFPEFITPTFT